MEVETSMLSEKCVLCTHAGSVSRSTLYRHEQKRRQEEAVAAGLEQPPPVQRKHKKHKIHECQKCNQALNC